MAGTILEELRFRAVCGRAFTAQDYETVILARYLPGETRQYL